MVSSVNKNEQSFKLASLNALNDNPDSQTYDAYLTPESKDSSSDHDSNDDRDWNEQEIKKLKYLLYFDLTKTLIHDKVPGINLAVIMPKIQSIYLASVLQRGILQQQQQQQNNKLEIPWTRGEVHYIAYCIQTHVNIDELNLPLRNGQQITSMTVALETKLSKLINIKLWSSLEISKLLYQMSYDLTTSGLFEELPDRPIDEIISCLHNFPEIDWSPIEVFYLKIAKYNNYDQTKINEELPFRSLEQINNKLQNIEPYNLAIDKLFIEYLLYVGFTRDRLRLECPDIPTRELVYATFNCGSLKISDDELNIIKQCNKDNIYINYIQSLIQFRSSKFIESKLQVINHTYRRLLFKNNIDRLIYESQWFASDNFGNGGSSSSSTRSSRRKRPIQMVDETYNMEQNTEEITFDEYKVRVQYNKELEAKKKQKEEERRKILEQRRIELMNKPKKVKISKPVNQSKVWKALQEEAMYFQSVTGDRQLIKDNEKRKRQKTTFFVPPQQERQMMKRIMKKKSKKSIKKKYSRSDDDEESEEEQSEESESEEEEEGEEETEEEYISPYDPYDINVDSNFPMLNRQLFVDEISVSSNPSIPTIEFVPETETIDPLFDPRIESSDSTAANIITENLKRYKNLPSTFPKINTINAKGEQILNPNNKLRIRTLLYPQHCELFVLCAPKAEELNPIFELQKFFQIHYCLYFSHSNKLKDLIYNDFCIALEKSIQNNSFNSFMKIIDNWNNLMLALSPNEFDNELFDIDINPEIRRYITNVSQTGSVNQDSAEKQTRSSIVDKKEPTGRRKTKKVETENMKAEEAEDPTIPTESLFEVKDLDVEVYFRQIVEFLKPETTSMSQPPTPTADHSLSEPPVPKGPSELRMDPIQEEINQASNQCNLVKAEPSTLLPLTYEELEMESIGKYQRPKIYRSKFFESLNEKTTLSRYCMQQLLVRVYSRVVSTRSSMLRKYKAFTAEVYGELLPSFVSEVLTKVGFKPGQKFYDLGSGVGNTSFQAALEFGAGFSGGCELMEHASKLTEIQTNVLSKQLKVFGIKNLNMEFVLSQSFVKNEQVRQHVLDCDVLIINNYLFDMKLNFEVGRLLYGIKPGAKIISLRNFITPRYKSTGDATVFDYLNVEKHEMSDFLSVSWTANKVPYYISTVESSIQPQYLL